MSLRKRKKVVCWDTQAFQVPLDGSQVSRHLKEFVWHVHEGVD